MFRGQDNYSIIGRVDNLIIITIINYDYKLQLWLPWQCHTHDQHESHEHYTSWRHHAYALGPENRRQFF